MQPASAKSDTLLQGKLRRTSGARIALPSALLVVFVFVASMGYIVLEPEYTWLEAVYMTVITIATVGFKEVHELGPAGQLWTIFVIAGGLVTGGAVISMLAGMVVEGQLRRILGRRQLERRIERLSGHAIICGYGQMGMAVAGELQAAGRDVVVVDKSPEQLEAAELVGLLYVRGDAQEEAILKAAGIENAGVLVAALSTDAENVFLTLTAHQANPKLTIVARAMNETSQKKLRIAGATRVVCPQTIGATRMVDVVLRPAVVDFVEMAHKGVDLELDELRLRGPEQTSLVGKTLRELELPRRVGVQVVAIRRADGQAVYHPGPDETLQAGDRLVLIGQRGVAEAVQALQDESEQPS